MLAARHYGKGTPERGRAKVDDESDSDSDSDDERTGKSGKGLRVSTSPMQWLDAGCSKPRRKRLNTECVPLQGESDFWRRKMRTLHGLLDLNKDGVISYDDYKLLADRFVDLGHLSAQDTQEFHKSIQVSTAAAQSTESCDGVPVLVW